MQTDNVLQSATSAMFLKKSFDGGHFVDTCLIIALFIIIFNLLE